MALSIMEINVQCRTLSFKFSWLLHRAFFFLNILEFEKNCHQIEKLIMKNK